jgi:hypothetical protein
VGKAKRAHAVQMPNVRAHAVVKRSLPAYTITFFKIVKIVMEEQRGHASFAHPTVRIPNCV